MYNEELPNMRQSTSEEKETHTHTHTHNPHALVRHFMTVEIVVVRLSYLDKISKT